MKEQHSLNKNTAFQSRKTTRNPTCRQTIQLLPSSVLIHAEDPRSIHRHFQLVVSLKMRLEVHQPTLKTWKKLQLQRMRNEFKATVWSNRPSVASCSLRSTLYSVQLGKHKYKNVTHHNNLWAALICVGRLNRAWWRGDHPADNSALVLQTDNRLL